MYKNKHHFLLVALFCSGLVVWLEAEAAGADKNTSKTLDTDPNLAGWWKFDEASGKTASDSSKHGRTGTLKEGLSFDKN